MLQWLVGSVRARLKNRCNNDNHDLYFLIPRIRNASTGHSPGLPDDSYVLVWLCSHENLRITGKSELNIL